MAAHTLYMIADTAFIGSLGTEALAAATLNRCQVKSYAVASNNSATPNLARTRRHVAENLLRSSCYTLTEVAFLTGFSEQSAFNRAFKRWTGQTPTAFREVPGP